MIYKTGIRNCILLLLALMAFSAVQAQQQFVELRRETSCFDNTRCINQDFNVSIPLFDLQEKGNMIKIMNDSIYKIALSVLNDMNSETSFKSSNWKHAKEGIDSCDNGITSSESRDLYYSIVHNEDSILSLIIRHDWFIEKQMILESDFKTAAQQQVYCFNIDLASDKIIDVNSFFTIDSKQKITDLIRSEYELNFDEDMTKAGDRLRFSGILINSIDFIVVYTRLLPNEQSEVRTVEIPLSEVHEFMTPYFQGKFELHD